MECKKINMECKKINMLRGKSLPDFCVCAHCAQCIQQAGSNWEEVNILCNQFVRLFFAPWWRGIFIFAPQLMKLFSNLSERKGICGGGVFEVLDIPWFTDFHSFHFRQLLKNVRLPASDHK